MEHTLRCNALRCRKEVKDRAVVTTCSHIFCLDCAGQFRISDPPLGQRPICPACDFHLSNLDDAVITNLNPTEDYKTSVLSGLSPTIILECAGRALSFWTYQTSQEVVYQDLLARSLTEKYNGLNLQMDKVVHDANSLISELRTKMHTISVDHDRLRLKNDDLLQALREKNKKYLQTQELYDKLKRRAMLGQVQNAASDAVDYSIQTSMSNSHLVNHSNNFSQNSRQPSGLEIHKASLQQPQHKVLLGPSMPLPVARHRDSGVWNTFSSHEKHGLTETPSSHRQRLAMGGHLGGVNSDLQQNRIIDTTSREGTSARQPLTSLSPSAMVSRSGFSGYGMSAGVKISHPQATAQNTDGFVRPTIRPRVAQRPGPISVGNRVTMFGAAS